MEKLIFIERLSQIEYPFGIAPNIRSPFIGFLIGLRGFTKKATKEIRKKVIDYLEITEAPIKEVTKIEKKEGGYIFIVLLKEEPMTDEVEKVSQAIALVVKQFMRQKERL